MVLKDLGWISCPTGTPIQVGNVQFLDATDICSCCVAKLNRASHEAKSSWWRSAAWHKLTLSCTHLHVAVSRGQQPQTIQLANQRCLPHKISNNNRTAGQSEMPATQNQQQYSWPIRDACHTKSATAQLANQRCLPHKISNSNRTADQSQMPATQTQPHQ